MLVIPLRVVAENNDVEACRYFIDRGEDVNVICSKRARRTPLHYAAEFGNIEICKLLIEAGAKVDAIDKNGDTPLLLGFSKRRLDVCRFLIESGADVNVCNKDGKTCLSFCLCSNFGKDSIRFETFMLLLDSGAEFDGCEGYDHHILNHAIYNNYSGCNRDIILEILSRSKSLFPGSDCIQYSLYCAISNSEDDLFICQSLVDHGASVSYFNNSFNYCYLHLASRKGFVKVCEFLLENGCDLSTVDIFGMSALHHATFALNSYNVIKLLLGYGLGVNDKDINGMSVLHHSIVYYYIEDSVILLLENGADINAMDIRGRTPLHIAVEDGNVDACRTLLENGADVNAGFFSSDNCVPPLMFAIRSLDTEIALLLLHYGANPRLFWE